HQDDMIVTPFAQILASLKNVRKNFVELTKIPPERSKRQSSMQLPLVTNINSNNSSTKTTTTPVTTIQQQNNSSVITQGGR
ncbi:unnamed protein product, partial [Didymodactylos carnosus]